MKDQSDRIEEHQPDPTHLAIETGTTFLRTLFEEQDLVLFRPIETWVEAGQKLSRVDYRHTIYPSVVPTSLQKTVSQFLKITAKDRLNFFFGVCPRIGPKGRFDLAWQIRTVRVLWADIDHVTVEEARGRIEKSGLPAPSIIVNSGNGVHLYWLIDTPFLINDAGDPPPVETEWIQTPAGRKKPRKYITQDGEKIYLDQQRHVSRLSPKAEHIQDILAGIAKALGADHTTDLSRLLRVPGSLNRKDERNGREPVPTVLVECDPTKKYPLATFEPLKSSSPETERAKQIAAMPLPKCRRASASKGDKLAELIAASSIAQPGSRSEADFAVCCYAIRNGIDKEEVWAQVERVGKFAEQGRRYFDVTWGNAEYDVRVTIYEKLRKRSSKVRRPAQPVSESNAEYNGDPSQGNDGIGSEVDSDSVDEHSCVDKPRIDAASQDLPVVTAQAWQALELQNNPPYLFRYAGQPSRIEPGDEGEPIVKVLGSERMRHELARAALWYRLRSDGDGGEFEVPAWPSKDVVADVLATPDIPFPVLSRIVEAPVFAGDGSLQLTPGYHPASRTFYSPSEGFEVPGVSPCPTIDETTAARQLILDELLGDFPFVPDEQNPDANAERAHAVAFMLLPFARSLISGPTPFHLFEKPKAGTGATLLVDVLGWPVLGRPIMAMTEGTAEEEWRKRLTAKLMTSPQFVLIDNLRQCLDSAALASAITSPTYEDRIITTSSLATIHVQAVWVGTGNNPSLSNEMSRRTIRIRMDAKLDRPWLRKQDEFRHPNLREWVKQNRAKLVWAVLTLIQAWLAAGQPQGKKTLGMFEEWARVMGGILEVAGIKGFLGNLIQFYDRSDSEGQAWRAFLLAWWNAHQDREVKSTDLWKLVIEGGIPLRLGDKGEHSQKIKLGKLLGAARDSIFAVEIANRTENLQISQGDKSHQAFVWKLVKLVKPSAEPAGECGESGECFESPRTRAHARARAHVTPVGNTPHTRNTPQGPSACQHDWQHSLTDDGYVNTWCSKCNEHQTCRKATPEEIATGSLGPPPSDSS